MSSACFGGLHHLISAFPRTLSSMMCKRRPKPAPISDGAMSYYLGSTPPEAYLHPDRRMLTPSRAGRVKAGHASRGHRRLGLDATEHDGTLAISGLLLCDCASRRRAHPYSRRVPWQTPGSAASNQLRLIVRRFSRHQLCAYMTCSRGTRDVGDVRHHNLVCGRPEAVTMMQSYASAASSEAVGPSLFPALTPWQAAGSHHLELSSACGRRDRAETFLLQLAGRSVQPCGASPVSVMRHRAISSLRANAMIIGLRALRCAPVRW